MENNLKITTEEYELNISFCNNVSPKTTDLISFILKIAMSEDELKLFVEKVNEKLKDKV